MKTLVRVEARFYRDENVRDVWGSKSEDFGSMVTVGSSILSTAA